MVNCVSKRRIKEQFLIVLITEIRSQSLDVFQGTNITFESSVKVVSTCSGLLRPTKKPHSHYQQPWRLRRATSQDASLPSQTSFKSLKIFFWSHTKLKNALFRATTKPKVWIFRTFFVFLLFINTYTESPYTILYLIIFGRANFTESSLTLSLPRVTLQILLCLTPDDFTHQRETPWEWKG